MGMIFFIRRRLKPTLNFLDSHPEINVTYNSRFELNHSSSTIRELWRPPRTVSLVDLVLGFPFSPSDMVLRRDWAFQVNLFDEYHTYVGEDLDINCRLALVGCRFTSVDRALNYRRYYSRRTISNLRGSVEDTLRPLNKTFSDPRCPDNVLALKDIAPAMHLMLWSLIAFDQDDTSLGQEFFSEAVRLNPALLRGKPSEIANALLSFSIADEYRNHAEILWKIFNQMPVNEALLSDDVARAIKRGYLLKGARAIMWGRIKDGKEHLSQIPDLKSAIDQRFLKRLVAQLLDYEHEFGSEHTKAIYQDLFSNLLSTLDGSVARWFIGYYLINQAFQNYSSQDYAHVPMRVLKGVINDPNYLTNRGVISIFFRSIAGIWTQ